MWSGMFQLPTLERDDRAHELSDLETEGFESPQLIETFTHITTHRIVNFAIYRAQTGDSTPENRGMRPIADLESLAFSNAQVKAMRIAGIVES